MKIRHAFLLIGFSLCGCVTPPPSPVAPPGRWGKYSGPIRTEWERGRKMRMLEDAAYVGPTGTVWLAPKGWSIDGASIPKAFWCSVGGPYEDTYREASVFHDVACDQRTARWQDVHYMFYTAMRCSGVDEQKAKVLYAAVYNFGPRWSERGARTSRRAPAAMSGAAVPRIPTEAEAKRMETWIREANPSLEQIQEKFAIPGAPSP